MSAQYAQRLRVSHHRRPGIQVEMTNDWARNRVNPIQKATAMKTQPVNDVKINSGHGHGLTADGIRSLVWPKAEAKPTFESF
jgi:hypothetical protein